MTQGASSSSSSSSPSSPCEYDVFLSYRTKDTCNFTNYLFRELDRKGIKTFLDNKKLEYGENIFLQLMNAIENCKIVILVISEDYVSSIWCYIELVKTLQCKRKKGKDLKIRVIFYKVDISAISTQNNKIADAFGRQRKGFREKLGKVESCGIFKKEFEKVSSWATWKDFKENTEVMWEHFINEMEEMVWWKRFMVMVDEKLWETALEELPGLRGFEIDKNMIEADRLVDFVKEVSETLVDKIVPFHIKNPVGLDSHFKRICDLLSVGLKKNHFLVIHGSGGMGKTTIAKYFCNEMFQSFEGYSFLNMVEVEVNVKENSRKQKNLATLQKQLLFDILKERFDHITHEDRGPNIIKHRLQSKKVLIVVDDVENRNQLEKLVGVNDRSDEGSRIDWFGEGSQIIITTRNEDVLIEEWVDTKYKVDEMNPKDSLQLFSLHAFGKHDPPEDYVYLSNKVVDYARDLPLALVVLGSLLLIKKSPKEWEGVLKKLEKTLHKDIMEVLKISFDALEEDEYRTIFLDISCYFIGVDKDEVINILAACDLDANDGIELLNKRSLLTINEDNELCMHDMIREMGKAIVHKKSPQKLGERSRLWGKDAIHVWRNCSGTPNVEGFVVKLPRDEEFQWTTEVFSKMHGLRILHIHSHGLALKHCHNDEQCLNFENLGWICWTGFPFQYIPNNFHMKNLVILDLIDCPNLEQVWEGTNKRFPKLKVICVARSPIKCWSDFSFLPNLEKLTLGGCDKLVKVDESISVLSKLVELDLNYCTNLKDLPSSISKLTSLETLKLSFMSLTSLPMLSSSLCYFQADSCDSLERLAPTLSNLKHLRMLDLSWCRKLKEIEGLEGLESVEVILLTCCESLKSLAPNLSNLKHLRKLDILGCSKLNKIEGLEGLESIETINSVGCNDLTSFADKSMFQVISKDFGNPKICEIYSSADAKIWKSEISKLKNFVTKRHLATWEGVQVPNMEIQGVIIRIVYVDISSPFQGIPTLRVVVDNQSKQIRWEHKAQEFHEYVTNSGVLVWVIKISNCVWKSIAECGDIISISVQNDPKCSGIQIGVHFYMLQEKCPNHLQVLEEEKFFRYHGPEIESGSMDHDVAQ